MGKVLASDQPLLPTTKYLVILLGTGNRKPKMQYTMEPEDVRAYELDDEFNELFRDVELEDASEAVQCAEKAPTTRDGLVVAAVEGSDGEAIGLAGSRQDGWRRTTTT